MTLDAPASFSISARDGEARCGALTTAHGVVATPAFMPVATYGAVRGIAPDELQAVGAQMLLANTYHLHERPGEAVVAGLGGLHGFGGWKGPWLTDSGGFQITSLSDRAVIDEDGVSFASPRDGARRRLTPERAVEIQEALGADVAMVLDECRPLAWLGADGNEEGARQRSRAVFERTLRWAERAVQARKRADQALFAIVQGGIFADLRRESAERCAALPVEGFAHGGLGLGEEAPRRPALIRAAHAGLPEAAPRYLMGLGRPTDLLEAIECGVDLFDCVLPTRNGRHGVLYTRSGPLRLRNARYREDAEPIEPGCDCPACRRYSRGYLRHLLHENEMLGARMCSLHNLRFYMSLLERARRAISENRFHAWAADERRGLAP